MFEDVHFLLAIQLRRRIVRRGVFHGLPCQVNRHRVVGPTYLLDPLRRDEHQVAEPPVARVHDEISNRPGLFVDEQALYRVFGMLRI